MENGLIECSVDERRVCARDRATRYVLYYCVANKGFNIVKGCNTWCSSKELQNRRLNREVLYQTVEAKWLRRLYPCTALVGFCKRGCIQKMFRQKARVFARYAGSCFSKAPESQTIR
jgi:hypothetical protein